MSFKEIKEAVIDHAAKDIYLYFKNKDRGFTLSYFQTYITLILN